MKQGHLDLLVREADLFNARVLHLQGLQNEEGKLFNTYANDRDNPEYEMLARDFRGMIEDAENRVNYSKENINEILETAK